MEGLRNDGLSYTAELSMRCFRCDTWRYSFGVCQPTDVDVIDNRKFPVLFVPLSPNCPVGLLVMAWDSFQPF